MISVASIGAVLLLLNGILWACQEVTSSESKAEFTAKKDKLEALKAQVEGCQSDLDSYKYLATDNTLDSKTYDSYKSDLAKCNGVIDEYNQLVPVVNELNKKANRRIYLIPIPIPRRAATAVN